MNYSRQAILFFCFLLSVSGCATLSPSLLTHLAQSEQQASQLIYVYPKNKSSVYLELWQKEEKGWTKTLGPIRANIGRNGFAAPGEKREGDGKTPSGTYPLNIAFGYEPFVDTDLRYIQLQPDDFWVDDPESPQYNLWVKGVPQAKSYETLLRSDSLYKYAVVIEYNAHPIVPGHGSAIFLHVWRGQNKPTAGCVSISEENMKKTLKWLDRKKNPVIILGKQILNTAL